MANAATVALTLAAFALSYDHLAHVARVNGFDGARAWAWPGTVDLFIMIGELLVLRAALRHKRDLFAYFLTVAGSLGSIVLNVAGVGSHAGAMEYVVAGVPPVAALLAFAALMRQVGERIAVTETPKVEAPEQPKEAPKPKPAPKPRPVAQITSVVSSSDRKQAIEEAWMAGRRVNETAAAVGCSPSYVSRMFRTLNEERVTK